VVAKQGAVARGAKISTIRNIGLAKRTLVDLEITVIDVAEQVDEQSDENELGATICPEREEHVSIPVRL
jgi:hypothetical protein